MANTAAAFAMAGPCVAAPEASVASSHGSMPVLYTVQAPVSVVASQSPAMSRHEMPMLMYVLSMALLTAAKPSGMLAPGIMFVLTVAAAEGLALSSCGSSAAANA